MSGYEPDYEAVMEDREERRGEAWMERMARLYGRVEDYRPKPAADGEAEA